MKKSTKLKIAKNMLISSLLLTNLKPFTIPVEAADHRTQAESIENLDYMVSYYSKVYGLNHNLVEQVINEKTRNNTSYEFSHYCVLDGKQYDSQEEAIIEVIKNIYENPSAYFNDKEKALLETNTEHEISMSPEELCEKYAEVYNVDKTISMSICYSECGADMDSANCVYNNNPAGLGPYIHFENLEIAYIYYISLLKNGYNLTADSDISFFNNIASIYCPDNPSHWTGLATSFYYQIQDDFYLFDPNHDKIEKHTISK